MQGQAQRLHGGGFDLHVHAFHSETGADGFGDGISDVNGVKGRAGDVGAARQMVPRVSARPGRRPRGFAGESVMRFLSHLPADAGGSRRGPTSHRPVPSKPARGGRRPTLLRFGVLAQV